MSDDGFQAGDDLGLGQTIRGFSGGQKLFNRYTLKRQVGRGGMGVVWLAIDDQLEEEVALKFLPELVSSDPEAINELKRETKRSRELNHHHIVRIHDFLQDELVAGISMEYVDGKTLAALKIKQPSNCFRADELDGVVVQLCDALDYAHRVAKIVHRDLKPANLMINSRQELKVTDFGIARSISDSVSRVSVKGSSSGTLVFMSPQQADGESATALDDIYAVGATLYDLLTGKTPFFSGDIYNQLQHKEATPVNTRRKEFEIEGPPVPAHWEVAIAACLAKDPTKRPRHARELLAWLQAPNLVPAPVGEANAIEAPIEQTQPPQPDAAEIRDPIEDTSRGAKLTQPALQGRGKRVTLWITGVAAVLALLFGLSKLLLKGHPIKASSNTIPTVGSTTPSVVSAPAADASKQRQSQERAFPAAVVSDSATAASKSWGTACAKCHGADGKGRTKMGQKLGVKDLTDAKLQEGFGDDEAFKAIKEGLKDSYGRIRMRPAEGLSDEEIKTLVAYVRTFVTPLDRNGMALQETQANEVLISTRPATKPVIPLPTLPPQSNVVSPELVALKDHPWTNSLGQPFVPVPGTRVLFCVWDTRVQDFQEFVDSTHYNAKANMISMRKDGWDQHGDTWSSPGFRQEPTHPVVGVNWNDTQAFCAWLTAKEKREGKLPAKQFYRLPTDAEWSTAVGLNERIRGTPQMKDGKVPNTYPWGNQWPPPRGAGNFAGQEAVSGNWCSSATVLTNYNDSFPRTSPVGWFQANQFGLFDMAGNVYQWCGDAFDGGSGPHATRGSAWAIAERQELNSSSRGHGASDEVRSDGIGFRCVLEF